MFNSILNLSNLDGNDGFVINGVSAGDRSGFSVSNAGDVNNDGIADLIIGAPSTIPNGTTGVGETYVVFGNNNIGSSGSFNLSNLDGNNGFVISEINSGDFNEISVNNAGDVNNDGIDDFIIGASTADPDARDAAGETYVVFGDNNIGSSGNFNLSTLNGSNGFIINGANRGDRSGRSVSNAGDINGDGITDLIIGAPAADPNGSASGISYVVFGGADVGNSGEFNLADINGINGFAIEGGSAADFQGFSVSNAGDVNNDGFDDLIVGASTADPNGNSSGVSYVVFGGVNVGNAGSINPANLNGINGFALNGVGQGDFSGRSVSNAGDINNDGFDDLIIGAPNGDSNGNNSGESYVVFGNANIGGSGSFDLSSLNGNNGFVINGISGGDFSGRSVSNAGDLNGDNIDDLIIGAARSETSSAGGAGESYVVFGGNNIGSLGSLDLSTLDGSNGFMIQGVDLTTGYSVSNAEDVNNDGIDDIIIGAYDADGSGDASGQSYVIFGNSGSTVSCNPTGGDDDLTGCSTANNDTVDGLNGNDTLAGGDGDDILIGKGGDDEISGDSGNDILSGGGGNDTLNGGLDNDTLKGNGNNDVVNGDSGDDRLIGGNGDDTLNGGTGIDTLIGGNDNDFLSGNLDNDRLLGRNGNDTLDGGSGADNLKGDADDDYLIGGLGRDTLNGGSGADIFAVASGVSADLDVIVDFTDGVDFLELTGDLSFGDLTFNELGTRTFVVETSTNQKLAVLMNVDAVDITESDFV